MFALGILALGVLCFVYQDSILGRPPAWPPGFAAGAAIGFLTGTLCILSAIAIFFNRRPGLGALTIALCIVAFTVIRLIVFYKGDWLNSFKTMALLGGALIVIRTTGDLFDANTRKGFLTAGTLFLAAFFVAAGYAHFKFADFVADFIPAYIPFRAFFGYFCGVCLVAGGIGMLIPGTKKLAALLSGVMLTGWFLLLHIPRFLADTGNMSDRLGLFESFAFAGICFMLAGIFRKDS